MSRYASYGSLDDRIDQAGDVGFAGFNNRLRPDQLEAGMLADAQNIRLDRNGQAQVRRGVDLIVAPLSVSLNALTLPIHLRGEFVNAGSFIVGREYQVNTFQPSNNATAATDFRAVGATYTNEKAASSPTATSNTLTITVTGHGRSAGTKVVLASTTTSQTGFTAASSGTKIDGLRTIASVPDENTLTFTITGITNGETINTNNPAIYDDGTLSTTIYQFIANAVGSGGGDALCSTLTATASTSANVLTISLTGNLDGTSSAYASGVLKLSDVDTSVISPDPNGDRAFTRSSGESYNIIDQNYSGSDDTSTSVQFGILADNVVNKIYGSTDFSDPNAESSQYIIVGSNTKAIGYNLDTTATFDMGYPAGTTYADSIEMIQAFNKVFIFKGGSTALENNLKISTITSITRVSSSSTLTATTSTNHNLETGDLVSISNVNYSGTDQPEGIGLSVTKVNDTQFTYIENGGGAEDSYTVTSLTTVATDFTKVQSGTYTQPVNLAATGFTITNGVATVTVSNTLSAGDTVTLITAGGSGLTVNTDFTVSEASSSEFKFFVNSDNVTNQTDVHFTKRVSVGLGFSHMPAPPFATYHQRRLVMPFQFSVDASSNSFTTRNIQDEIIASDILDTDTYDQVYAQYRFNAGTSDFVVGLHSFAEDRLLVFNRNSIHIVANTTDLQSASTQVLTDEVGCVARQSIEQVGNQVIFLSDNGVYGTQFLDEYNLRGTETPLSEPINETIGRINKNAQENAVAVYFDNRYYIAVPLDSSSNNNAILIYNFLNKQWESIDAVNESNYHISNLLVLGDGDRRGVYAVNDIGGVHRLDHRVDGVDRVITQIGGTEQSLQIAGALTTRQYTFGTLDRKRWKEFDFHIQSSDTNTSDLNIDFETENPDDTGSIGTLSGFNGEALAIGEDVSIRGRIGNRRGYGIQFTFNNTVGRPIIRAIEVEGATTMRSINKAI